MVNDRRLAIKYVFMPLSKEKWHLLLPFDITAYPIILLYNTFNKNARVFLIFFVVFTN